MSYNDGGATSSGLFAGAARLWRQMTERRGDDRYDRPKLHLEIENHDYETMDWSLSGFKIAAFHRELQPRDHINLKVVGGIKSLRPREFIANVARITPNGDVGFHVGVPAWEAALVPNQIHGL